MKTNAIIRIVIFSLAILVLVSILFGVVGFDMYVADGVVHNVRIDNVEIDAIEPLLAANKGNFPVTVRNLEIEWAAGSITIVPDESVTQIMLTEYAPSSSDYDMVCRQSGQTLKIQFSEESMEFPSFGINVDVSKDLTIQVPADWVCGSLEIDAAAAEVEIHDLQIDELDFDGASGALILDNCDIVELDIDTASGDVEFKGVLKELDFDAASANFRGEFLQCPNQITVDSMSGDLELILPSYCGFTCELDAMSGSFDSDFEITTKGSIYTHGDGKCVIKVSAMSGDVDILKGVDVPETNR